MVRHLKDFAVRASAPSRLAPGGLDFGEAAAFLIVIIGFISFASAGRWSVP